MRKRVSVAAALVLLVLLVGFFVQEQLLGEPELPPLAEAEASGAAPSPSSPAPSATAPAEPVKVTVTAVSGGVEHRTPGGDWQPLSVGDALGPQDQLRTLEGGRAELRIGEATTIRVAERTQFSTADVSSKLSKLKLRGGRISATVTGNAARLEVRVHGSDAVAVADDAEFSMLSSGEGDVVVATEAGNVALTASGRKVDVAAGTFSQVVDEEGPTPARRIPTTLFVKVARPDKALYRQRGSVAVRGETTPGAIVSVNGVRAKVTPEGGFTAEIPLREGPNDIVVTANDVLGRKESQSGQPIVVDSSPPKVESEVTF